MTTKTQLSTFLFETHIIRTLSINNEPWFVVADLCKALELSSPTKAILNLDEDEVALNSIQGISKGNDKVNLVSESGMYTLILRCRDAVKKGSTPHRFRKWVTAEVLPQIRKTGKYEVQPQQLALPEPEKKYIDNRNKPQYTEALSKNTKRLPHPSDLAVFLCQFNGGMIAGKYNTLMGIPSSGFLCIPESESRHPQTNVANLSKNTKELAMANIITAHYNGTEVFFQDDAYLNATAIAKHFNKRPNDWLALPTTQEYIETLCKKTETRKSGNATEVGKSHFVKTVKGGKDLSRQGTWLHRRLAVAFARWLNVEFAIWCDEQIEKILINKNKPQQLALPEPEKKYTFSFTEYELQQLAWAWFAFNNCTETLRKLYSPLRKLGSHFAPKAYVQGMEYYRLVQSTNDTINRITKDFKCVSHNNWRVLEHVRNFDKNAIVYNQIHD